MRLCRGGFSREVEEKRTSRQRRIGWHMQVKTKDRTAFQAEQAALRSAPDANGMQFDVGDVNFMATAAVTIFKVFLNLDCFSN